MFHVDRTNSTRRLLGMTLSALTSIVAATVVTILLVLEVRKEQAAVDEMMQRGAPRVVNSLQVLSGELRWQLPLTILVLLVLIATAGTLVMMARAYLRSQRMVRETQTLAWDILASIDQGVITADRLGMITSVNPEGRRLFELTDDCLGKSLDSISQNETPLGKIGRRVLESGKTEHDCDFIRQRAGHTLRLRADCSMLRNLEQGVLVPFSGWLPRAMEGPTPSSAVFYGALAPPWERRSCS